MSLPHIRYNELPKIHRFSKSSLYPLTNSSHKNTIGQYFTSSHCLICNETTTNSVCKQCMKDPGKVTVLLTSSFHKAQMKYYTVCQVSQSSVLTALESSAFNQLYLAFQHSHPPIMFSYWLHACGISVLSGQ